MQESMRNIEENMENEKEILEANESQNISSYGTLQVFN